MSLFGTDTPPDADAVDVDRLDDAPDALYIVYVPDDADGMDEWIDAVNEQTNATFVPAPDDVRLEERR